MIYKIFHMRTFALSYQNKGPPTVNWLLFIMKPVLAIFTVVGPFIWCYNPQVRMSKILYINNNDFHHLGRSHLCAGARYIFSPSKPHSGTLCLLTLYHQLDPLSWWTFYDHSTFSWSGGTNTWVPYVSSDFFLYNFPPLT